MKYDDVNFKVWLSFRYIYIYIYIIRYWLLIIRGHLKSYDYMFYYVVIPLDYAYIIFHFIIVLSINVSESFSLL